ncbi:MAG: outer membrane lipoprotein-sorting protein, partial [Planctomycetota bacterium]
EITGKVWWRRFEKGRLRVLLRVQGPEDLRGSALLLIERSSGSDMFLYLPELRKTRRITSHTVSGSLFGSDFTYEDFQQIQGINLGREIQALPDATLDGVPVHVIAQRPAPGTGSSYERVVSYVTRDGCVPIRSEMWEPGERLRKLLTADLSKLYEQKGVRIPTHLRMEDRLSRSSTDLVLSDIEVGKKIPRRYFEMTALERSRLD